MTEQEIKSKRDEIYKLKDQIRELESQITNIECELKSHYLTEAEKELGGIKRGDKVIVTTKTYTRKGDVIEKHGPLFFAYARYNRFAYEINDSLIEFVFWQVKKNGEPSQRETCFYRHQVVKAEKVTE
jgi:hypothetical protein